MDPNIFNTDFRLAEEQNAYINQQEEEAEQVAYSEEEMRDAAMEAYDLPPVPWPFYFDFIRY